MSYLAALGWLILRGLGNVAWEIALALGLVRLHRAIIKEMER